MKNKDQSEVNYTELTKYWPTSPVAAMFDVCDEAVRNWRTSGDMPYVVVLGNKHPIILFNIENIIKWAERTGRAYDRARGQAMVDAIREKWESSQK